MKLNRFAFLVAVLVLLAGCATPRERYAIAERTLSATADAVKAAVDARLLDGKPEAMKVIRAGLIEANAALAKAQPHALANQDPDTAFWTDRVLAIVAQVSATLAQAKAANHD